MITSRELKYQWLSFYLGVVPSIRHITWSSRMIPMWNRLCWSIMISCMINCHHFWRTSTRNLPNSAFTNLKYWSCETSVTWYNGSRKPIEPCLIIITSKHAYTSLKTSSLSQRLASISKRERVSHLRVFSLRLSQRCTQLCFHTLELDKLQTNLKLS